MAYLGNHTTPDRTRQGMAAANGQPEAGRLQLLTFAVDGHTYALPLSCVERVVRAVELRPLPGAPAVICGIFSLGGRIIPVCDVRRRLGLPAKEIELADQIAMVRRATADGPRTLGLLIEGAVDVTSCAATAVVAAGDVVGGTGVIDGIGRTPEGLVLIHNLEKFLSVDEERELGEVLRVGA